MKNLLIAAGLAALMEAASALILVKFVDRKIKKLEKEIVDGDNSVLVDVNEAFKIHEKSHHQRKDA